jgi:hypothetical protein
MPRNTRRKFTMAKNLETIDEEFEAELRKRKFSERGTLVGAGMSFLGLAEYGDYIAQGYIAVLKHASDFLSINPSENMADFLTLSTAWSFLYGASYGLSFILGGKAIGEFVEKQTRREIYNGEK